MNFYFHNKTIKITKESYAYVYEYKKQLLCNIEKLLCDLNVRHVISHGNLIEYERQKSIYHDDDIDIRIDNDDLSKLNFSNASDYNLSIELIKGDWYIQKGCYYNWYHAKLVKFVNNNNILEINMPIFADIVCNKTNGKPWVVYDIDFNDLREIEYMGISTFAPSKKDTVRLLELEYGKTWIIPNYEAYSLD